MRLGKNQLRTLRSAGTTAAFVLPTRETRRLCELGLMREASPGGFAHNAPAGLRALADAAEAGEITLFVMPDRARRPADAMEGEG